MNKVFMPNMSHIMFRILIGKKKVQNKYQYFQKPDDFPLLHLTTELTKS